MTTTTADRVRVLIEQSGLGQGEFAEHIGLDKTKMSKSLSGTRRFSSLDLARIAEVTGASVDWLITGDENELAMAARVAAGTSTATATAEARRLAAVRTDLVFLGYPQPWQPVAASSRGSATHRAEALAEAARARLADHGFTVTDTDVATAIEAAFGADVAIADLGPDVDGLAVGGHDVQLILASTSSVPWRQRFTIAHELGHLLSQDDHGLHLDEDIFAAEHRRRPSEQGANAFAAALLMPTDLLRQAVGSTGLTDESFAALACRLRVSPSALAVRLSQLRLVAGSTFDRFRGMTAQRAAQLAGAAAQHAADVAESRRPRVPGLLARDTYAAYLAGDATLRPYANLIGQDVETLRDAFESVDGGVAS
jgi:Zn-dependent peptidase ImmA (M78 family)/transcriptional regulator with XRE-family HTH domain